MVESEEEIFGDTLSIFIVTSVLNDANFRHKLVENSCVTVMLKRKI